MSLNWIEIAGYLASALVILTFSMKTMFPMRIIAILSNVAFIAYGIGMDLMPVILLHCILLPVNLVRTAQQFMIYRNLRTATNGDVKVEALLPFMTRQSFPAGTVLFLKGDEARSIYYLNKGAVDIPEVGKTLEPGALFGEMGLFAPDHKRTASAVCAEASEMMVISERDIISYCLNEPSFALFLTKLIAGRMIENQRPDLQRS